MREEYYNDYKYELRIVDPQTKKEVNRLERMHVWVQTVDGFVRDHLMKKYKGRERMLVRIYRPITDPTDREVDFVKQVEITGQKQTKKLINEILVKDARKLAKEDEESGRILNKQDWEDSVKKREQSEKQDDDQPDFDKLFEGRIQPSETRAKPTLRRPRNENWIDRNKRIFAERRAKQELPLKSTTELPLMTTDEVRLQSFSILGK